MPSGKTHDKITMLSVIPIFLTGICLFKLSTFDVIVITLSSVFSQFMFGPDLDTGSIQYKRWGLLKWIWLPYKKIMKHRSRFSHGIITSPLIRFIYFITSFAALIWGINYLIDYFFQINFLSFYNFKLEDILAILNSKTALKLVIPVFIGFFTGTAIHTVTDKIESFFKGLF